MTSNTLEKLSTKDKYILEKNKKFFSSKNKYMKEMLDIINRNSDISIRILEYFVTNYSKKNNIAYKIRNNGVISLFNVYIEYNNQLNAYSKKYLDAFCRKKKIIYSYYCKEDKSTINFKSSIGQLNFFHWAIRNRIIKYVKMHLTEIENDMRDTYRLNKQRKIQLSKTINSDSDSEDEIILIPDPVICSSSEINKMYISPSKEKIKKKNNKNKRQKISSSVYDYGITKKNISMQLDFD